MGLRCLCDVSVALCPEIGLVGFNNTVEFLVNVTGLCENCTATCSLSNSGTCTLTSTDVSTPSESIPVGPGETLVTANVIIQECPITVTLTVTCLDEFGRITCTESADCPISNCVA
ncbi:hypothetical protein [Neobacillus kokaensis]|uniref:DUF3992 domain-containing protein n=1 Tax=Neobacillus kokaensis TaxID=2759023 RepID=A0ABQ3NCL1_9BACI|nr:hypothetical protein [Neobacillus kokaensis]GHI01624.1 hypothetical protein AM1BK_51660 [Neobacillus kokaensis]